MRRPWPNGCTRTAAPRFSFDAPGFADAGLAASARFGRRSVIRVVSLLILCILSKWLQVHPSSFLTSAPWRPTDRRPQGRATRRRSCLCLALLILPIETPLSPLPALPSCSALRGGGSTLTHRLPPYRLLPHRNTEKPKHRNTGFGSPAGLPRHSPALRGDGGSSKVE
jgi:hypothetical protein